ncbi:LEAF RUST 10 DISEASE-RESISTANCE LOCUS RECEPTOR-LIKE PROTEIN KINASE-like 2.5 isoform X1 [Ananas comosus]|uniref:LEAF RUST 10 DISEASE-RESISTANCE LOCUS RECEPTOR-LIKE PROTEIN KINASE-like 2.5 isoform X1 n=1 Tax=Ananas comosus TaxID=4615 RepID=A0A6P5EVM6_ANACO|nr:LEAF RUST 10 DISEASE-RESISTANCE LOCUS RECEPTOR-LIKE PROTEIN KINASE-like 2.5 isoform X1 [Ananas comosus]
MRRSSRPVISREGIKKHFNCSASRSESCCVMLCLLLLLLLTCVGVAEGRKKHVSCFSSCGHLHDIGYPFRLKSDLPGCGSPNYELLCDSGKPMLELGSAKYYITNISYKNMTISVIDPVFVNDNKYCPLPLQSPPPDFSYLYDDVGGYWALFVNCTRPIHDGTYQRGPNCLSSNNSFVYVVADMWGIVEPIKPSCGFLASIPMSVRQFNPNNTDIFELLKEGFMLSWDVGRETSSAIFHECLNEAKRCEGKLSFLFSASSPRKTKTWRRNRGSRTIKASRSTSLA